MNVVVVAEKILFLAGERRGAVLGLGVLVLVTRPSNNQTGSLSALSTTNVATLARGPLQTW